MQSGIPNYILEADEFQHEALQQPGEQLLSVCIRVSYKCNLKCCYCISESGPTGADFLCDDISSIISILSQNGPLRIVFSGGEPLLYGQLNNLVSFSKSLGNINVVATNGLILPNKEMTKLVDWFQVSCPSVDQNTYHMFRKSQNISTVISNTQLLIDRASRVSLLIPLCNKNFEHAIATVSAFSQIGVKKILLVHMAINSPALKKVLCEVTESEIEIIKNHMVSLQNAYGLKIVWPAVKKRSTLEAGYLVVKGDGSIEKPNEYNALNILSDPNAYLTIRKNIKEANRSLFAGPGH